MEPVRLKRKHTALELLTDPSIDTWTIEDRDTLMEPIDVSDYKNRQEFMESGFNPNAYNSNSKATGRFQITPIAHKEYQLKTGDTGDLFNPEYNEKVRDWYMENYLPNTRAAKERNHPLVKAAVIAGEFNAGHNAMVRELKRLEKLGFDTKSSLSWVDHISMPETKNYIKFIVLNKDINKGKNNEEYQKALLKRK